MIDDLVIYSAQGSTCDINRIDKFQRVHSWLGDSDQIDLVTMPFSDLNFDRKNDLENLLMSWTGGKCSCHWVVG